MEALLENARASRNLVREEIAAGASLQHVYDELVTHERQFGDRLAELQAFNKSKQAEAKAEAAEAKAEVKSDEAESAASKGKPHKK